MQSGTSGPRGKCVTRSTVEVKRLDVSDQRPTIDVDARLKWSDDPAWPALKGHRFEL